MPTKQRGLSSAIRIQFGPFELNVAERSLKKANEVVPLGGRAFDLLVTLIDRAGKVVSKNDLIAKVWPDVTVEEGSLRVHLSALRKALGDGRFNNKYIENLQGRGYCFVAPVTYPAAEDQEAGVFARPSSLPAALGRMIGRSDTVWEIRARSQAERLMTIVGAGGIGKTTVAVAAGHAALPDFAGAVFFVDLSSARDRSQVVSAIASAIGLNPQFADPDDALFKFLSSRRALIILDSCEHLIEKTAEIADCILRCAPRISLLATSREALQIAGERVFPLHPLGCPPEQPGQTAAEVLSYPAARLFVERVSARGNNVSLGDDTAPIVAEICRKLDGIALAIELAAGRAAIFGVKDTMARLGSRLDLLKFGRRTANPRHQTLRATLDWSHDYLSDVERVVLRRVAILTGHFTLEAAIAVAEEEGIGRSDVTNAVGSLVEKSLVGIRVESRGATYRLLDTTRSYALEKLIAGGEYDSIAARHANFLIQLLEAVGVGILDVSRPDSLAESVRDCLGNVRAALEWSFGPDGNDHTAVRLAAAAAQLFLRMSLLLECRHWMERAIDCLTADCDPRHRMEVHAALAFSFMFTEGNSERVREAFLMALTLAERHGDADQQLRLLSGLSMYFHRVVDTEGALEFALRSEAVAKQTGNPDHAAIADSMLGAAYCLRCDQRRAQEHLKRSLRTLPRLRRFDASQDLFDRRTFALSVLTHSLFFSGDLDQAVRYASRNIAEAERAAHPIGLCRALMNPMRLYFWIDDMEQVERSLSKLECAAERHSLAPVLAVALGLRGRYLVRFGRAMEGMQYLRDSLEQQTNQRYEILLTDFVFDLVLNMAKTDARAGALALVDQWISDQVKANKPLRLPLLFLAKGLAFASGDSPEIRSAEACFEKAMTQARLEAALPFELRAALELARVWIARGEARRAHDLIGPIYNRFSEGFATPDLILTKRMLEQTDAIAENMAERRPGLGRE